MHFVKDENGNHIFDSEGNKITFDVVYETNHYQPYTHREPLHINANNHVDTENRNIIIKDGVNSDHAVSKAQLDSTKADIVELIQSSIQTALNKFSTNLFKFINNRMKGRVGKKTLAIPKTNYTWIKLLDSAEIDGVSSLDEVLILNTYIKRSDRYHHAKSDLVASSFDQLEFFFDSDRKGYYTYFNGSPSDWNMECIVEYVKIPKKISVEENSDEEVNE